MDNIIHGNGRKVRVYDERIAKEKENNIDILFDTRAISDEHGYFVGGKRVRFNKIGETTVFYGKDLKNPPKASKRNNFEVVVEDNDTFGYVLKHRDEFTSRPLVLNFANAYTPGGGVRSGCRAQEESLCRCSNLLESLESLDALGYYETNRCFRNMGLVQDKSGIISRDITVFKDSKCELIEEPMVVDVITVAALNRKRVPNSKLKEPGVPQPGDMIKIILDAAENYGYKELVLGAIGCGAFGNDPNEIACYFKQYLEEYEYHFTKVAFAVPIMTKKNYREYEHLRSFNAFLLQFTRHLDTSP